MIKQIGKTKTEEWKEREVLCLPLVGRAPQWSCPHCHCPGHHLKVGGSMRKVAVSTYISRIWPALEKMAYIPSSSFQNFEPQICPMGMDFQAKK